MVVLSFLFLVIFYLLGLTGLILSADTSLIGEASRWCERVSAGAFREPVNTLSNLGFMVVGLYLFWVISNESTSSNNNFIGITSISLVYAFSAWWLGPGSMLMHGTNTEWGGWADNLSMIMYIIFPWLYNISLMARWSLSKFINIYVLIVVVYSVVRWFTSWDLGIGFNLFGTSIGLWVISEFLYKFWSPFNRFLSGFVGFAVLFLFGTTISDITSNPYEYWWTLLFWLPGLLSINKPKGIRTYRWYFLGMIAYMSAFAIWLTGVPNNANCNPDSLIQAHGIWHILSAIATYFFFLHYRSEKTIG
jgi:hypothetical protein